MDYKYQILPLGEQNLAQIMSIERDVFVRPWSASLMKDSMLSAHTESWGLFDQQRQLLAFVIVSVILDEAEILNMAVSKKFHNQGCGQKILEYIIQHLHAKN